MLNKITFVIFYQGSFKVNVLVESFLETQLNIKLSNSKKKIVLHFLRKLVNIKMIHFHEIQT